MKNITNIKGSTERHRLQFLDGLRGLAAVYVMVGHARWLLWEGYSEGYLKHPEQYDTLNKLVMYFLSLFKFGHEAVMFFFVLSGFVIHLKYAKNLSKPVPEKFNWAEYFIRRVKRIYPPFILALLITFLLDTLGRNLHWTIYYGLTPYQIINENIGISKWDLKTFLGNLFFLYTDYVPVYGTNGPAWSLKYEWWFYILYPLFLLAGTRKIIYPTAIIIVLFVVSFYPQYWPEQLLRNIFAAMITWWLGVLLAEIYTKRIKANFRYVSMAALVILVIPFLHLSDVLHDSCIAIFFFGLISFFLSISHKSLIIAVLEKLKKVGDFSYTLYIIHFPILVFMSGWIMQHHGNVLPTHFLYVFIGIFITIIVAYLTHFVTEVPFTRSGRKEGKDVKIEVAKA